MKRPLKVAAGMGLGLLALWLLMLSVDLFLVGVVIGLVVRLAVVLEQRDEAQHDLVGAWFEIADLEQRLRRHEVVDVPLYRPGKSVR